MNASNEKNKYWLKGPIKIKGVCCKQGAQRLVVTFRPRRNRPLNWSVSHPGENSESWYL